LSANTDSSVAQHTKKSPGVKNRRTSHATDLSADGYYHPNAFNQKSPSSTEENNVADKKSQETAVKSLRTQSKKAVNSIPDTARHDDKKKPIKAHAAKNTRRKQRPAIVSIDHKKMVELSFGWPIKGRILKRFSPSNNKGIDIAGKKGQSVKATETGQVVYGGQGLFGFGKLLIIKHNDDYLSAYANASRLLVKEGQCVDKGQYIAEVGDVGIKRTSLHFEIRKNGKPVNPFILLPKK
jgi:lipoprotein NlpD